MNRTTTLAGGRGAASPARRRLLASLLAGLALPAAPALAQRPGRRARIGLLMPYAEDDVVVRRRVAAFRTALTGLGWSEARNLDVIERWPGDSLDAVRAAAAELVARDVEVILTTGSRVVPIVQRATRTIPIVFVGTSDPVGQGLVASLMRPGGNTTGFSQLELSDGASPLVGKQVELLRELLPGLGRLGLMFNPENPAAAFHQRSFRMIGETLGVASTLAPVRGPDDMAAAIAAFADALGTARGAMVLPSDLSLLGHRGGVVAAMARHGLPAIYADESFVEIGGLASYSADRLDLFRRSAIYVDRILRGERAGDLPVQMPTNYALAINLATARALCIEVPATVLARAELVVD
jgi:putative ABC transport system substrate-binding protein